MLKTILQGMAVGITETVPGVSGSTVAMILGVYERLIGSLNALTSSHRKNAIPFLILFGIGMVGGFAVSILVISYFLTNFRTPTLMLFAGIIVGFLPFIWKETVRFANKKLQTKHYIIMAAALVLVAATQFLVGTDLTGANLSIGDYLFLFFAGFIASTALVLPGISGALILTILGVYELATHSLKSFDMQIVLTIGAGVILGILLTSKLIHYLLEHYISETYSAMVGLITGSIFAIFASLEGGFTTATIIASIVTFIAGFMLMLRLNR